MMSLVTWLVAGGLAGWAASRYLARLHPEAVAFDVVVGVLGAVFVGWVVAPLVGVSPGPGVFGFFVAAFGAAALLFCVHLVRQTVSR
jgi:uncharacterized membrane protein YeaQ/YmgE (transglycosylase-associated protein family)